MSPLQTSTLASSILLTATKLMIVVLELAAHKSLVDVNIAALIGHVAVVSWVGFLVGYCRDYLMRRITLLEKRFSALVDAYGQGREEDGRLDAAREYARAMGPTTNQPRSRFTVVD